MNCIKTAEPIEMQFGMLSWVSPGNMHYMGMYIPHGNGHFWGVWPIEKHCKAQDFGWKGELCKTGELINDLYVIWDVFVQRVAFWESWWLLKFL